MPCCMKTEKCKKKKNQPCTVVEKKISGTFSVTNYRMIKLPIPIGKK